jgi:uncharacterized protein YeaO (DUF488 family)
MGYDIRFKRIYDPATEADGARVQFAHLLRPLS